MAKPYYPSERRANGFDGPLHLFQLTTWILFGWLVCQHIALIAPFLPQIHPAASVLTVLIGVFACLTFGSAWICTAHVPTDKHAMVTWQRQLETNDFRTAPPPADSPANYVLCPYCMVYVAKHCKHCRECDRCVPGFDHHCKFINNCINNESYVSFIVMLASVLVLCVLVLVANLVVAVAVLTHSPPHIVKHAGFKGMSSLAVCVIALITAAIAAAVFCAVAQLLMFHINLIWKGLTTYEYIVQRRSDSTKSHPSRASSLTSNNANSTNNNNNTESSTRLWSRITSSLRIPNNNNNNNNNNNIYQSRSASSTPSILSVSPSTPKNSFTHTSIRSASNRSRVESTQMTADSSNNNNNNSNNEAIPMAMSMSGVSAGDVELGRGGGGGGGEPGVESGGRGENGMSQQLMDEWDAHLTRVEEGGHQ